MRDTTKMAIRETKLASLMSRYFHLIISLAIVFFIYFEPLSQEGQVVKLIQDQMPSRSVPCSVYWGITVRSGH